jgi:hypothetical protein
VNFLDAPRRGEYKRLTEETVERWQYFSGAGITTPRNNLPTTASLSIRMIISVIAGSCAIKNHKPRQVRKEAAVVTLFMCAGVPGYPFL